MKIKRPISIFLFTYILGIIIAYETLPTLFKIVVLSIAIFLYAKLYQNERINFKIVALIILMTAIGIMRFKSVCNTYDKIDKRIEAFSKGTRVITGKIDVIGESTNSNYFIIKNCYINDVQYSQVKLYFSREIDINAKIGNTIKSNAKIFEAKNPTNEGEFNQKNYNRSVGIAFTAYARDLEIVNDSYDLLKQRIYEIKTVIKNQIKKIFNEKDAGLFIAMVTGDRSKIDKPTKKMFQENGIAHIIAISGLHLSILGLVLFEFLRNFLSLNVSAGIVSIFIFLYGIFIDASPTSLRAIYMLYIRFISLAIGRTYDSKNALYFVGFAFLIHNPYLLFNSGFQFSYVAIFALNHEVKIPNVKYIREKRREIIRENVNKSKNKLFVRMKKSEQYFKIPAIIVLTIFLLPITIYHYFTYPLYSMALNLIVIPLMTLVLLFGLLALFVSFLYVPLGNVVSIVVKIIFLVYKKLCLFASTLPFSTLWVGKPNIYAVLYYYIVIFLLIYSLKNLYITEKNKKQKVDANALIKKFSSYRLLNVSRICICFILLIMSISVLLYRKKDLMRLTMVSIGQGDSMVVQNNDLILSIDGGSSSNTSNGEYVLLPHMKSRAINHIDYAFITHADADHTNGIMYILNNEENFTIKNILLPINAKVDNKFNELKDAATANDVNIIYLKEKDNIDISDDIKVVVLSPNEESISNKSFDQNELSLTFRLDYKNHSCLFTGDIGKKTMNRMINDEYDIQNMEADILKAPHHGSKNSNVKKFFEIVDPKYTIISYDKNNTYGHPSPAMIDNLTSVGANILKTAESGQIDLYLDKEDIYYKTYIK